MATTTDSRGAAALALASIAAEALAWALRAVLVPALALLLTVCGYRPARPALKPATAPALRVETLRPARELPVRELRQLARAAGFKKLARSGRRDQLLAALSIA